MIFYIISGQYKIYIYCTVWDKQYAIMYSRARFTKSLTTIILLFSNFIPKTIGYIKLQYTRVYYSKN